MFFAVKAICGPAGHTSVTYSQPDGSVFNVTFTGDEWMKIRRTKDGCAIIKDNDGWWCYGIYDSDGRLSSSGHHVGKETPEDVINASRQIPYSILSEKADIRRQMMSRNIFHTAEGIRTQSMATRSANERIQKRGIVILAQFQDVEFKHTRKAFERMLNETGYNGTGSAKDYYQDQFGEQWEFCFDVSEIVTLPNRLAYYGENEADGSDIRPAEMIRDACRLADATVDFSLYDQDGDTEVDNVYVFYAGGDESTNTDQPHLIWAHQYYIFKGEEALNLICDGVRIDRYACSSELDRSNTLVGIGPFCHEYGHTLGLADMYDTDYESSGGWAAGLWKSTSLMDGGNYNNNSATPPFFNCIEREMLGLSQPVVLEAGISYTLEPVNINGTCYRLETDTEGEYYLFECRSDKGWDKYIGGHGLLVYHIDKNGTDEKHRSRWIYNTINTDPAHQCADLIEADGRSDKINTSDDFRQGVGGIFFPQSYVTSLTDKGHPSLKFRNGNTSDISVTGIHRDGDNIIFNVTRSSDVPNVASVLNATFTAYPDAVTVRFSSSDSSLEGKPVIRLRKSDSNDKYEMHYPAEYEPGKYICKINNIESGHISYEALIRFENEQAIGKTTRLSFMTKRKPAVTWPYIFIQDGNSIQYTDGMELHVVNASSAEEIIWTYNGSPAVIGKDLKFYPENDGTLKVEILNKDGSCEILTKELRVAKLL